MKLTGNHNDISHTHPLYDRFTVQGVSYGGGSLLLKDYMIDRDPLL